MKEKKTVLAVILGVSLVSLITAIVATAISTFTFFDYEHIATNLVGAYKDKEYITMGILQIVAIVLALAFLMVFVLLKKKRAMVNWILMGVTVGYYILSILGLRIFAPARSDGTIDRVYSYYYELFVAYFTPLITLAVATLLTTVSSFLLERENKKEQQAQPETAASEAN